MCSVSLQLSLSSLLLPYSFLPPFLLSLSLLFTTFLLSLSSSFPPPPPSLSPCPSPLPPPSPLSQTMEVLEQERLQQLQSMLIKFTELVQTVIQPTQDTCQDLLQAAEEISCEAEVDFICSTYGTGPNQPEQLLVDYYVSDVLFH